MSFVFSAMINRKYIRVSRPVTPDAAKAYVTNTSSDTVSVINTATNAVVGSPFLSVTGPSV